MNSLANRSLTLFKLIAFLASTLLPISYALADDIDIYLQAVPTHKPNVLLLIDTSDSMYDNVYGDINEEHRFYQATTSYPAQAEALGQGGDDQYIYLYERSSAFSSPSMQNDNSYYRYYNKIPKSALNPSCQTKTDLYATTLDDYDWNNTFDAYRITLQDSGGNAAGALCREADDTCNLNAHFENGDEAHCQNFGGNGNDSGLPLFVFDANQHNFLQQYYRFYISKIAVKNLLNFIFDSEINYNLAIASFHYTDSGSSNSVFRVHQPFVETNPSSTTPNARHQLKSTLKSLVDQLEAQEGGTPLVESLWEIGRYFRGESPDLVDASLHASGTLSSGNYLSPITASCDSNHVVLFTDGAASYDDNADDLVSALTPPTGSAFSSNTDASGTYRCKASEVSTYEGCGAEFIDWLNLEDHSRSIDGHQTLISHVVGLVSPDEYANDSELSQKLRRYVTVSDRFYEAIGIDTLQQALIDTFSNIEAYGDMNSNSVTSPALSVSSYNSLTHRDQLYFSLFKASPNALWLGNIKRYALNNNGKIVDSLGTPILDGSGKVKDNVRSWWMSDLDNNGDNTNDVDGANITIGGIATADANSSASLSTPNQRRLFTWWGGKKKLSLADNAFPVGLHEDGVSELNFPANNETAFIAALATHPNYQNDDLYPAMAWARGGTTQSPTQISADFIHNSPTLVSYFHKKNDKRVDETLFVGSNLGFLHAINPDDGNELFAYMPEELLPNIIDYYKNTTNEKTYGLDAQLQVWRHDANGDGTIVTKFGGNTAQSGEFVYLYQAMRRGGEKIYALDVTNRRHPKVMWTLSPSTPKFSALGQTWSTPQRGRVQWCYSDTDCSARDVLFFGGGYDTRYDDYHKVSDVNKGSALFMVDAHTGKQLWSAGSSSDNTHSWQSDKMRYSFPSDITLIDLNNNGLTDFIYAADITGQLWQFDFTAPIHNRKKDIKGGRVADLSNLSHEQPRRFFSTPDVSVFRERGNNHIAIVLTSGNRVSPNEKNTQDALFIVQDTGPFQKNAKKRYKKDAPITINALLNLSTLGTTDNPSEPEDKNAGVSLQNHHGYVYYFKDHKKSFSGSLTFGGRVMVTTYQPPTTPASSADACDAPPPLGETQLLTIDVNEINQRTQLSNISEWITHENLPLQGLPPRPMVYLTSHCLSNCKKASANRVNKAVLCVGLECKDSTLPAKPFWYKTYWRDHE